MRALATLALVFILALFRGDAFNTASIRPNFFLRQKDATHISGDTTLTPLRIHSTDRNTQITHNRKVLLKASSSGGTSGKFDLSLLVNNKSDIYNERTQISQAISPAIVKRFVAASLIISSLALGLQQPAYANALDILQEKVMHIFR